jgi:hypothetical protein
MSVIVFELTEKHVKLLKHLRWSINAQNIISGVADEGDDVAPPFGENNIYDAIDLILNGVPENFNPLEEEEIREYTDEQKAEWDKLYNELPTALDVILYNASFELGTYKTKYHDRNWRKVNNG